MGRNSRHTAPLATNEVVNVVRRHTPEEVFKKFYGDYHVALQHVA